jgi:hypothetical protein
LTESAVSVIQEKIENYIDYLDDLDYIDSVLETADLATAFSAITQMLRSGSKDHIPATNRFIGDAMRFYYKRPDSNGNPSTSEICMLFREQLPGSTVVDALHTNVFSPIYNVRDYTVYTLGRMGLKTSLPVLKESFRKSLDTDPLLLPQLISALDWQRGIHIWKMLEKMARSPHAMTRWATLGSGFLDYFEIPKSKRSLLYMQRQMHLLNILKDDEHPLVRKEAEYKCRQCQRALHGQETVDELEQPLFFEIAQIRFRNHLGEAKQDDYSVSELEAFMRQL